MIKKFVNLFRRDASAYKRNLDFFQQYVHQTATYLTKERSISYEQAREFVLQNLRKGGRFEFKDAVVEYLERESNGDRARKINGLSRYIGDAIRKARIIAPTLTVYLNPKTEIESLLAKYVDRNIKLRGIAKKLYFAAKAAKNKVVEGVKKIEQTGRKLDNNAISGAHVSASTPLANKTAHSTLTSTCRTTSGYGNANNEKFLAGNRHYYSYTAVINNITSIISNVDYDLIKKAMEHHRLSYPSVEQTVGVIERSAHLYWRDERYMAKVREYVAKLSDLERAAFCYVGDFWHLMQFNQEFVREFLTNLSRKVVGEHADAIALINSAPEGYVNLAHQLCAEETRGIGKDYAKIEGTQAASTLACTIENVDAVLSSYKPLIDAFWMTDNVPAGVAHFPSSVRRTALASDTDSTIFTVQDWVIWYSGRPGFDTQSMGVYYATVFLTSATITHVLATMSANIGVVEEKVFRIEMKSEFSFDVFVPTQLGKHYYAAISCQEGNVFSELDYEIKGAQLKNANVPRALIKEGEKMMKDIITTIMSEKKIKLGEYLARVADIEESIIAGIRRGEAVWFRNSSIKDAGSYAGEQEDSPYQHHFFWMEVFSHKYGEVGLPPYGTKKLSVTTDTPTKLNEWIKGIEDRDLAARLAGYLSKNQKRAMSTVYIPTDLLAANGIPAEIEKILDYEKVVTDLCGNFYILLETLGYYAMGEKKIRRLVSRSVPKEVLDHYRAAAAST